MPILLGIVVSESFLRENALPGELLENAFEICPHTPELLRVHEAADSEYTVPFELINVTRDFF